MSSRDSRATRAAFAPGAEGEAPQASVGKAGSESAATVSINRRDAPVYLALAREALRRGSGLFTFEDITEVLGRAIQTWSEPQACPLYRLQKAGVVQRDSSARRGTPRTVWYSDVVVIAGADQIWPERPGHGDRGAAKAKAGVVATTMPPRRRPRMKPEDRIRTNREAVELLIAHVASAEEGAVTRVAKFFQEGCGLAAGDAKNLLAALQSIGFLNPVEGHRRTYLVEVEKLHSFLDGGRKRPPHRAPTADKEPTAAAPRSRAKPASENDDLDAEIARLEDLARELKVKKRDNLRTEVARLEKELYK